VDITSEIYSTELLSLSAAKATVGKTITATRRTDKIFDIFLP
jgi:hypothetical protein